MTTEICKASISRLLFCLSLLKLYLYRYIVNFLHNYSKSTANLSSGVNALFRDTAPKLLRASAETRLASQASFRPIALPRQFVLVQQVVYKQVVQRLDASR